MHSFTHSLGFITFPPFLSFFQHKQAPAPAPKPKPKREEPYARGHSTLPPRTHPVHTFDDDDEDDRRKSADDFDGDKRRPVQLITKEELIRCYSPAGSQEGKPEPKRPSQKERESDQVAKDIKRYSQEHAFDDHPPTEVKTEKVLIGPGGGTQVYHQRLPPEVQTQSYTISSVGGPVKEPVTERTIVTQSSAGDVQSAPGGTADSSRVVVSDIPSVATRRVLYDQPVRPVKSTGEVTWSCYYVND